MSAENKVLSDKNWTKDENRMELTVPDAQKLRYPYCVNIMLISKFCETFTSYAIRAVITLYLTQKLNYDNDTATIIFHSFSALTFFACVFSAIISDGWLGNFRTILCSLALYFLGVGLLSIGSVSALPIPELEIALIGLFLCGICCGAVKPCYPVIAGDQFKLPEQAKKTVVFFAIFSLTVHLGTMVSQAIAPILRQDVGCFGENDCYPLSFGVAAIFMIFSFVIFLAGKRAYVITAPTGNIFGLVITCISHAIHKRFRERKTNPKEHWLDYAEEKYGKTIINDTKIVLNVMVLLLPLPFYWALFELQGSRWTLQATQMNGELGFYRIKPDQMQLVNSLLMIMFIPMYQWVVYPLLAKIGISRPLQKLTIGGTLAGLAVLLSGLVELKIADTYAVLPTAEECHLRVYNGMICDYTVHVNHSDEFVVKSLAGFQQNFHGISSDTKVPFTMEHGVLGSVDCPAISGSFNLRSKTSMSYFITHNGVIELEDDPRKSRIGDAVIRVLVNARDARNMTVVNVQSGLTAFIGSGDYIGRISVSPSLYDINIDGTTGALVHLAQGSVSTILIAEESPTRYRNGIVIVTAANSVNMLWQLPQYVSMALGGAIYTVLGMVFTYGEAPASMKAVMQSLWLAAYAFGHLIDIVIVSVKFFESQANEFFLFAGLMFVDMIVFSVLAYRYKSMKADYDK